MEEFILNVDQVDWSRTRAYRFPLPELTEGLAINLRGRQPRGIVEPGAEYDALRAALLEELLRLHTPDGDPLIAHAWLREELFSGDHAADWPDIVFRLHPDVQAGTVCSGPLFSPVPRQAFERHSGTHDERGILIACGAGVKPGSAPAGAGLLDVAPTVFRLLDVDIPPAFEGRVLRELLADDEQAAQPEPTRAGAQVESVRAPAGAVPVAVLSAEDERTIRDRLHDLGYL
jgi:predicted AlkP superfamily phosphohydrolase/phosphomutase